MATVIGYARVSLASQASDGVSLEMQEQRINAWAVANGHELGQIFVETGSGARSDNRPELQKAIDAACKAAACKVRGGGVLVVYSLSRFSRSVSDTLALADKLNRAGAHLASLTESFDTSSPGGKLVFTIMSSMAEFERSQLRQRTSACLAHLRKANRRISFKVPYGHVLAPDGQTLLPCHAEQAVIRQMIQSRADGVTLAAIAESLNSAKVPTREGKRWYPATISGILNRQEKLAA